MPRALFVGGPRSGSLIELDASYPTWNMRDDAGELYLYYLVGRIDEIALYAPRRHSAKKALLRVVRDFVLHNSPPKPSDERLITVVHGFISRPAFSNEPWAQCPDQNCAFLDVTPEAVFGNNDPVTVHVSERKV